jgi:hypothetical protein
LVESGHPVEYGQPLVQLAAPSRNLSEIETSPADPRRPQNPYRNLENLLWAKGPH